MILEYCLYIYIMMLNIFDTVPSVVIELCFGSCIALFMNLPATQLIDSSKASLFRSLRFSRILGTCSCEQCPWLANSL